MYRNILQKKEIMLNIDAEDQLPLNKMEICSLRAAEIDDVELITQPFSKQM